MQRYNTALTKMQCLVHNTKSRVAVFYTHSKMQYSNSKKLEKKNTEMQSSPSRSRKSIHVIAKRYTQENHTKCACIHIRAMCVRIFIHMPYNILLYIYYVYYNTIFSAFFLCSKEQSKYYDDTVCTPAMYYS